MIPTGPRPRAIPHNLGEAIFLPEVNLIYLPIRKNAHTAILDAIIDARVPWLPMRGDDFTFYGNRQRLCLWRNPFDRIESAYRYFSVRKLDWEDLPNAHELEFNDWVEAICAMPDHLRNPHVKTQAACVTPRWAMPQIIVPWNFVELATQLGIPEIPKKNASEPRELVWNTYTVGLFRQAYEADLGIWSKQ